MYSIISYILFFYFYFFSPLLYHRFCCVRAFYNTHNSIKMYKCMVTVCMCIRIVFLFFSWIKPKISISSPCTKRIWSFGWFEEYCQSSAKPSTSDFRRRQQQQQQQQPTKINKTTDSGLKRIRILAQSRSNKELLFVRGCSLASALFALKCNTNKQQQQQQIMCSENMCFGQQKREKKKKPSCADMNDEEKYQSVLCVSISFDCICEHSALH